MIFLRIIVSKWSMCAPQSALCFIKTSMKETSGQSSSTGSNICYGSAATRLCVQPCRCSFNNTHADLLMLEIDIITSFESVVLWGGRK